MKRAPASATAISDNNVVGCYQNTTGFTGVQSFLYDGSTYTTLAIPGVIGTWASGVSGNNVVGYYQDGSGVHGFLSGPNVNGEINPNPVPIPSAMLLLGSGLIGILGFRRKFKK